MHSIKGVFHQPKPYNDFDKENDCKRGANVQLSRHCRVQSTFALNIRREKSANTSYVMAPLNSTSQQNISTTFIGDPNKRPPFRVQLQKLGVNESYDVSQQGPTSRTRDNSFNITTKIANDRVRTEVSQPLRQMVSVRTTSMCNNTTTFNIQQNPQTVGPYLEEIIKHMILMQKQDNRTFNAFGFQTELTEKMRSVLLDWIVDVHLKFKLQPETLFLTIYIIDLVLEQIQIPKSKFQLYGISALYIAAKYEEVYQVPHIRDLVFTCDNAFTKTDILQTEGQILQTLNFNILSTSSWRFLSAYQETLQMDRKSFMLSCYLIELALIDFAMIKYPTNTVASAAMYLVNKILRSNPSWPESYVSMTQLTETDVRPCAKDLCSLLQNADRKAFNSLRKKFALPKYMEVSRIKIQKKQSN